MLTALFLLAALLIGLIGARPLYNLYREITFSWTEHSEAEEMIKAFAEEQRISYSEYPQFIIDLYENNPETEEFVLNYPFRQEETVDLSGYNTDTVPLFLQWDPMWGYTEYGSSILGVTGCGPACLVMAGYYLTGEERFTPDQIAAFSEDNGYYAPGYGTSWTLISEGAEELGLSVQELPLVKGRIVEALESGSPVILALGPRDFTSTGHFIVLAGMEDGLFRVNDPNSPLRSERLWSYEELEGQIRNIWVIS